MIKFDSIWIDMDGTLMDWSKGNIRKALIDITDSEYYRTLRPTGDKIFSYLSCLKSRGIKLHIISGIPDYYHCEYVPIYRYYHYYDRVCKAKDYTISKYFPGIFDSVNYTLQSASKAEYVKRLYKVNNPVFIDDYSKYINDWKREINDNAFKIDKDHSCQDYLKFLLDSLEEVI